MNKSEQINELAMALAKFQSEVRDAEKDTQAYSYKYARLDQIFDIIRPILSKHGLSFIQPPQIQAGEYLEVETWILHSSGQYISSSLRVPTTFDAKSANSLQKIGMAISYAKRYAIMGMLGICQKDEDNDGVDGLKDTPEFKKRIANNEPRPVVSNFQIKELRELMKQAEKEEDNLCAFYKVEGIDKLSVAQFNSASGMLKSAIAKKEQVSEVVQ